MSVFQIPTRQDLGHYTVTTTIVGEDFTFRFLFNERDGYWYGDLYDANGVLLQAGERIVLGTRLFTAVKAGMPQAPIFCVGINGVEAGQDTLGTDVLLCFAVNDG